MNTTPQPAPAESAPLHQQINSILHSCSYEKAEGGEGFDHDLAVSELMRCVSPLVEQAEQYRLVTLKQDAELAALRAEVSRLEDLHVINGTHKANLNDAINQLRTRVAELEDQLAKEESDVRKCDGIIDGLHARVAELEKDRERLDLLRAGCTLWKLADTGGTWKLWELSTNTGTYDGYTLDGAIDAARAKEDRKPTPFQPAPQDKPEVAP